MKRKERGITLIALVVTIIVLLILAGVSIQMLAGQSGILTQAKRAREETEIGQVKDYVQQEILEKITENNGGDPTVKQFHDILEEYFEGVPEYPGDGNIEGTKWENFPENFPEKLTTKKEYGEHEIEIGEIYSGTLSGAEKTPTVTGENLKEYQGSYVDIGLDAVKTAETTDDWEIFYAGEGRTFLIAADYVPITKLVSWKVIGETTTMGTQGSGLKAYNTDGTYPYSVRWSTTPIWMGLPTTPSNFMNLVKHEGYSLIDNNTVSNSKAVSQLLNTEAWSGINTEAEKKVGKNKIEFAIGGPTLEMWCAAWNAAVDESDGNGFKKITAGGIKENTGYYVSSENMTDQTYLYMNGTTSSLTNLSTLGEKYRTFFPHTDAVSNCYGYWLASPSADGSIDLMFVDCYGYVYGYDYADDYGNRGVRPVVCLTSGVHLQKNEEKSKGGRTVYDLV